MIFLEPPSGGDNSQAQPTTCTILQEDPIAPNTVHAVPNDEQGYQLYSDQPQTNSNTNIARAQTVPPMTTPLYSPLRETPSGTSSVNAVPPVSSENDGISDPDTEDIKLLNEQL